MDPRSIYLGLIIISVVCAVITLLISFHHFYQYYKNWTQPRTQELIIRIMCLVPIWAVLGAVIVAEPSIKYIIAILMDLYEGFAILTFMQLIYWYLGGKEQAHWKAEHKTPYRTCLWLIKIVPGEKFMKFLHVLIYQFAFTRPASSIAACILAYNDLYNKGELSLDNWPTMLVQAILYTCLLLAMWGLFQLYRVFKVVLAPYNVGYKFLAIKFYIFLHALQGFIFTQIEKRMTDEQKQVISITQIQYTCMCLEMVMGALLNKYIFFKYHEYIDHDALQGEIEEKIRLRSKSEYKQLPNDPLVADDV